MVDDVCRELSEYGRFDAIVCDFVLNSVDSTQAEVDVLNCIGALVKPGGEIFFSGRTRERLERMNNFTRAALVKWHHRDIEFLDENGITGIYRKGAWFFQKYHSREETDEIATRMGWEVQKHERASTTFHVHARKGAEAECKADAMQVRESLAREFNMPLNDEGLRLGRSADILTAYENSEQYEKV